MRRYAANRFPAGPQLKALVIDQPLGGDILDGIPAGKLTPGIGFRTIRQGYSD